MDLDAAVRAGSTIVAKVSVRGSSHEFITQKQRCFRGNHAIHKICSVKIREGQIGEFKDFLRYLGYLKHILLFAGYGGQVFDMFAQFCTAESEIENEDEEEDEDDEGR